MRFLRLLPFTALLLCACDKPLEEAKQQAYTEKTVTFEYDPEPSPEELAAEEAKIEELEREIENSTNLISDMEAFILMKRENEKKTTVQASTFILYKVIY